MVLAAAWHLSDTPCLAYFCLVTLQDRAASISEQFTVEVTKYNPPFQVSPDAASGSIELHYYLLPLVFNIQIHQGRLSLTGHLPLQRFSEFHQITDSLFCVINSNRNHTVLMIFTGRTHDSVFLRARRPCRPPASCCHIPPASPPSSTTRSWCSPAPRGPAGGGCRRRRSPSTHQVRRSTNLHLCVLQARNIILE